MTFQIPVRDQNYCTLIFRGRLSSIFKNCSRISSGKSQPCWGHGLKRAWANGPNGLEIFLESFTQHKAWCITAPCMSTTKIEIPLCLQVVRACACPHVWAGTPDLEMPSKNCHKKASCRTPGSFFRTSFTVNFGGDFLWIVSWSFSLEKQGEECTPKSTAKFKSALGSFVVKIHTLQGS